MTRPRVILWCGVLALALIDPACRNHDRRTGDGVTITFWHSFVASTVPALNELITRFEAQHPGIVIKAQYIPTGDALIQKLVAAIESGTAPDIAWIHADFLDKLVESHAIYRIDELNRGTDSLSRNELDDIFPPLLQSATWRDTLYALPMEATSLALVYNRDLLRKAGLSHPPETWDELHEYARLLTRDTNGDGTIDQYGFYVPVFPASGDLSIWMILQWTPFLWQAGGEEIDPQQSHVLFNSEAGVKALQLWKAMYDEMHFSTFGIAHDLGFASEHLAMVLDGPWNLPRYRQIKNFAWGVAPLPAGPAGRATYIAGEHLAVFRQSAHPQQAWSFLKWIVNPETQSFFSMQSGYLPVRRSTLALKQYREFLATDPALRVFVEQMNAGRGRSPMEAHRIEINRAIAEAIEKATLGSMDAKAALDEAAATANALLLTAAAH